MSLVEVAVALVLAGIGVSAVVDAGAAALTLARGARVTTAAVLRAAAVADSLAAAPSVTPDSSEHEGVWVGWIVEDAGLGATRRVIVRVAAAGSRDTLSFQLLVGPRPPGLH